MATAVQDSVPPSGNPLINGLLRGGSWPIDGNPNNRAHALTYSFTSSPAGRHWDSNSMDAVRAALQAWSNVADVSFTEDATQSGMPFYESTTDLTFTLTSGQTFSSLLDV